MNRCLLLAGAAALALASPPAPAVGPAVLIAKQIVQGFVKDFIEQRIDQAIRASFGPCNADLAEAAVATRRSLTGAIGGGGVPGLGALGALGGAGAAGMALRSGMPVPGAGLANAGATGAALQAMTGGGGAAAALGAGGLPGTSAAALGALAAQAGTSVPAIGAGGGAALLSTLPGSAGALGPAGAAGGADMASAMAMLQQMMSAPPLSDAEFDDFVRRLERFGKVAESVEPGIACSADDYRRLLGTVRVAGGPMSGMGGGMLRFMHTQLLEAEQRLAETATMFEQMSPADRADAVESLAADLRGGPPEGRRATLAMMDAGMLRMPPDMAAALRARLQP